jgi:hypothetical protein
MRIERNVAESPSIIEASLPEGVVSISEANVPVYSIIQFETVESIGNVGGSLNGNEASRKCS